MKPSTKKVMEAVNVSVRVRGGRDLLSAVNLALANGKLLALAGPNGSGKSTLIRALAGQCKTAGGEIRFFGQPLSEWARGDLTRVVGYLPQHVQPAWDLRVKEAVRIGLEAGPPLRDGKALWRTIMSGFELDSLENQRLETLSGGERARVFLAMTLARSPRILLADEPFASLDTGHAHALLKKLAAMRPGLSTVVVLHDLNLAAAHADSLVILNQGKVCLSGPPRQVLESPEIDQIFQQPFHRIAIQERLVLVPAAVDETVLGDPNEN